MTSCDYSGFYSRWQNARVLFINAGAFSDRSAMSLMEQLVITLASAKLVAGGRGKPS